MKENKQKAISKIDLSASAFMVIVSKCNDNDKILFIKEKKKNNEFKLDLVKIRKNR